MIDKEVTEYYETNLDKILDGYPLMFNLAGNQEIQKIEIQGCSSSFHCQTCDHTYVCCETYLDNGEEKMVDGPCIHFCPKCPIIPFSEKQTIVGK